MANHKSAAKRARQSLRRRAVNTRTLSSVRTHEKKLRAAISAKNTDEAATLLKIYTAKVDKAAQKGVVHPNLAARKISRLSLQVNALKG